MRFGVRDRDLRAKVGRVEVLLVTHDCFRAHDTGQWHPERPARLGAAITGVRCHDRDVVDVAAPMVDRELLERFHTRSYVKSIEEFCAAGGGALDPDTHAVAASWEAALRSAGAGVAAVDLLSARRDGTAFLAVRPPGHHALTDRAMGFCLFNNIGVTARYLLERGSRVAIVDWDVHHGNGTEDSFAAEADVLYVSFHQHPFYPGTGWLSGVGTGFSGETTINVPVPAGTAGDVYRYGFSSLVAPVIRQFDPEWILVSAGYDAHADDPLAELRLLPSDYAALARELHGLVGPARVIYFLEGGYDLAAITASVAATLDGATGLPVVDEVSRFESPAAAWEALAEATRNSANFWKL